MKPAFLVVIFVLLLEDVTLSSMLTPEKASWKSTPRRKRYPEHEDGGRMRRWNSEAALPVVSFYGSNYSPNPNGGLVHATRPEFTDEERRKLEALYGKDAVRQHYSDFEKAKEMSQYGAREHKIPWRNMPNNRVDELDKEFRNDAKLSNFAPIPPRVMVVDAEESPSSSLYQAPLVADYLYHCNMHGLWMSSVAGVAIELLPVVKEHGRIEIRTKLFSLPDEPLRKGILTSHWTGSGMISPESPTTMTIIFQEHFSEMAHGKNAPVANGLDSAETVKLPKTAVFVGQCLVCENDSPVLQGTWTVFPNTQRCAGRSNETKSVAEAKANRDTLHLFNKSLAKLT